MTNMFGGATDLYKNRFHTELSQLKYDEDDYVYYPDVIRRRWMWHQPVGGSRWSGSDAPAGSPAAAASQKIQFNIPNNTVTDPTSYRLYFKCYVVDGGALGTATNLCNYAHSVINQLTVRMTGSHSGVIEQVPSYNIFCSMLYQFYSTNYVNKFHNMLEGYSNTPANRVWVGRSFMLPLNVGFFLNLKKYIPNFALPFLQIEFLMETNNVATSRTVAGTDRTAGYYYYVENAQLICSEVEVTSAFIDSVREKISMGQTADAEVRLDFTSWTYMSYQLPATAIGLNRQLLTGNFVGIRKVMFAQTYVTQPAGGFADRVNSFVSGGLGSYRIQIGGKYYPDQEIPFSVAGATKFNVDVAQSAFFNMYSIGAQNNNWSDYVQDWSADDTFAGGIDTGNDFVFLLSTEFDDCGLPILIDMINSGPLSLLLNYVVAPGNGGVQVYVFVEVHQAIHIYDGNRATIVQG